MNLYKNILGVFIFSISCLSMNAQLYQVDETSTIIDGEYTNAMKVTLPSDADLVEEEWEEYLEDNYDLELDKVKRKKDTTTYISEKVISDNLNGISYDIYSKVVDREDGKTDLYTKWAFNENVLLESTGNYEKIEDSKSIMEAFAQQTYINYYTKQLNELTDERTDVVKDYGKFERRNEKLEKRNKKLNKKINNYKGKIDLNEEQKETNRTEMERLEKISTSLEKRIDLVKFQLEKVNQ